MISKEQYTEWRKLIDVYDAEAKRLYGQSNGWVVVPNDATDLPPSPSNEIRSAVEFYEWVENPPTKYFAYVKPRANTERMGCSPPDQRYLRGSITTWVGDELGIVFGGLPYRDSFDGERVSIDVVGNNGVIYYGTYYKSSGDYCCIKAYKNQTAKQKYYSTCEAYRTKYLQTV